MTRVRTFRAFTLIELLVVVAIIALLIAILVPSLSQAKRRARTVACGAKMNQIAKAMVGYGSEWNGAILGNVHTSAAMLLNEDGTPNATYNDNNCPIICESWDWMSPTAKYMNIKFNEGPLPSDRADRYVKLTAHKAFLCPENDILSTGYSGSPVSLPVHNMLSYNTAIMFQTLSTGTTGGSDAYSYQNYVPTGEYRPRIDLVGNASRKVFLADGARWSYGALPPDVNLGYLSSGSSPGGQYADWGPFDTNTRAYNRIYAPGNYKASAGNIDYRTYAFRHGVRSQFSASNSYKFNVVFFDGHVETLGDLEGADPNMWAPPGAVMPVSEVGNFKDVKARYFPNGTSITIQ